MTGQLTAKQSVELEARSDSSPDTKTTLPIPKSGGHPLPGLATAVTKESGIEAAASVKKKKKKKPADATPVVAPVMTAAQRRADVKKLTEEDLVALAAEWQMDRDDERFVIATTQSPAYKLMQKLDAQQRLVVTAGHLEKGNQLKKAIWDQLVKERDASLVERRRANVATLLAEDRIFLTAKWRLAPGDPRIDLIFSEAHPEYFNYFNGLTEQFQPLVTAMQITSQIPETKQLLSKARAERATAAKAAKEKLDAERAAKAAEQAKLETDKQHGENKTAFAAYRAELEIEVLARLKAIGITDPKFAKDFAASADKGTQIINRDPLAKLGKQTTALSSHWDTRIAAEQKKVDVDAQLRIHGIRLTEARKRLVRDRVVTAADKNAAHVEQECRNEFADQRNPDVDTWLRWMDLKIFVTGVASSMKPLAQREGIKVHFRVDRVGVKQPKAIDDRTSPENLLRQLFEHGDKIKRVHVTLETDSGPDRENKSPHKYWGIPEHELLYGPDKSNRWYADQFGNDVARVRAALDAAMAEIYAILLAKAKTVLDFQRTSRAPTLWTGFS